MKKKLIFITVLAVALTLLLSGCAAAGNSLKGKNIVAFEVNGGTLNYGTSSTNTKVNFAYHPGTYIIDPITLPNYSISRNGYNFTGWYTSAECKESEKWDFSTAFEVENLTLYAGWEKDIHYTYTVYYMNGDKSVALGSYNVSAGEAFEDWRDFGNTREDHTCIGYYSDPDCTSEWDFTSTHPGGEADLDIPVYVKHIEGVWKLVDNYDALKSAVKGDNVYLTANIDCEGKELALGDFNQIFEGNRYKVTNFTVNKTSSILNPSCAIFSSLGAKAVVRNVSFEGFTMNFYDIKESTDKIKVTAKVAALAVNMTAGAKVSSVFVSGTLKTDYNGEFPCISKVYYYNDTDDTSALSGVSEFTANITVDKQS